MIRKEYQIETECKRIARARGWVIWKNVPDGCKGIPDTSILSPSGEFIMVEFKRDKKAHIRPEQIVWKKRFPDKVLKCQKSGLAKMKIKKCDFCKSINTLKINKINSKNVKMSKCQLFSRA